MTDAVKLKNVEDMYPLSPMQQGMLFHTLYAPNSGIYAEQVGFTLQGPLDIPAFEQAWQEVVARHPIMRSAFIWEGLDESVQVVRQQVKIVFDEHDWQAVPLAEQQERLDAFLAEDRKRGFTLTQAPLMRFTLLRLASDKTHFVWSHHHMLMDGWSINLVLGEVLSYYHALRQNKMSMLPRLRPYRDYIAWLHAQDMEVAEAFWRQYLAGFALATSLPLDRLDLPSLDGSSGGQYAEHETRLPAVASEALYAFARQQQLTMNTLVQGAWSLLLSRYSGAADVVFGITVSGRPASLIGAEQMVGLFINTLPLRVQIASQQVVLTWLQNLQEQQLEARHYEYSPLAQVQGWGAMPPGTPLFESLVVFENYPTTAAADSPADAEDQEKLDVTPWWGADHTNYPLMLTAAAGSQMLLRLSYQKDRFSEASIKRLLRQLQVLLDGLAANPMRHLEEITLLTEEERQALLQEWHGPVTPVPTWLVHERIAEQAARTPQAIAVIEGTRTLTYAELETCSTQLARFLCRRGVHAETRIGLCLDRSLELMVGLLGILNAGGAYVPLDPSYPADRLAFLAQDSQIELLLTQEHWRERFATSAMQIICLDSGWDTIAQEESGLLPDMDSEIRTKTNGANLAYLLYTSGSTGQPKGVMVTHQGLANYLQWCEKTYVHGTGAGAPVHSSISFDLTVTSLLTPLLVGQHVALLPEDVSVEALAQALCHDTYTLVKLTPAHLDLLRVRLADEPQWSAKYAPNALIIGGEALRQEQLSWWKKAAPDVRLINEYGPTETAVGCCVYEVGTEDKAILAAAAEAPVPIGRPIPNMHLYLLDSQMQAVPVGMPGNLYIGGVQLARGYWQRPDLTAERVIPDPFSDTPGARLYRTGDVARYLADGTFAYLGRCDQQVKLRGFRIELEEIESVLRQHPALTACAVAVHEQQLVAYLVWRQENAEETTPLEVNTIQAFLQTKLPNYMLPTCFVVLEQLPLTPNGKLDRRALPLPEATTRETITPYIAPRNSVEKALAEMWQAVLHRSQVSVEDNFFALGGHSLLATQVISRIREHYQTELPLRTIFDAPTIEQLAEAIMLHEIEATDSEVLSAILEQQS